MTVKLSQFFGKLDIFPQRFTHYFDAFVATGVYALFNSTLEKSAPFFNWVFDNSLLVQVFLESPKNIKDQGPSIFVVGSMEMGIELLTEQEYAVFKNCI